MNTTTKSGFRIVLLPDLPEGTSREAVLDTLAARFGISREKAAAFLSDAPQVIKKGLSQQQALEFQKALKSCGLTCRLEWVGAQPPVPAPLEVEAAAGPDPEPETSDLPCCPNCGYQAKDRNDPLMTAFDGLGQCPACDIIVAKYRKSGDAPEPAADDQSSAPEIFPAADRPLVPSRLSTASGGFLGGQGKMLSLAVGFMVVFFIGYMFLKNDSPPVKNDQSSGRHHSQNDSAAEAARMLEDPGYVGPGPMPSGPHGSAAAAQKDQLDRLEAADLAHCQVGDAWFDEADARIEPGEIWQGSITLKMPFETVYLTIPPSLGGNDFGTRLYQDLDLEVSENPWQDKQVQIDVTGQYVSGYDFPVWVMADAGRVTNVLYPSDHTFTLEGLGQIPANELRDIEWSEKTRLPADFDPVFDLVQGWGHGYKMELRLRVEVPESLADYALGKYVNSRAETVYLKDRKKEKGMTLPLTLAKKKGDPALYIRPGKFKP